MVIYWQTLQAVMLATIKKQRNGVFWQSTPRGYNQKVILDRVCAGEDQQLQ
jgi:hypothetical protein